jgi:hypothetical protein
MYFTIKLFALASILIPEMRVFVRRRHAVRVSSVVVLSQKACSYSSSMQCICLHCEHFSADSCLEAAPAARPEEAPAQRTKFGRRAKEFSAAGGSGRPAAGKEREGGAGKILIQTAQIDLDEVGRAIAALLEKGRE